MEIGTHENGHTAVVLYARTHVRTYARTVLYTYNFENLLMNPRKVRAA